MSEPPDADQAGTEQMADSDDELIVEYKVFPNSRTSQGVVCKSTWWEFLEFVLENEFPEVAEKDQVELLVPAKFKAGATDKSRRSVEYCTMIGIDCDDVTDRQVDTLLARIQAEKTTCLIYNTYSHPVKGLPQGLHRLRVLFPLSRRVYPHEWPLLWEGVNELYGGVLDPKCKDPTRGYFMPACPPETPENSMWMEGVLGEGLAVDKQISGRKIELLKYGTTFRRGGIPIGTEELTDLAKKLRRKKVGTGEMLRMVLRGHPFAQAGHRDDAIFKLCRDLAREFPRGEAGGIAAFFQASLSQMPGDHPITVEDVQEKLERAQADVQAEEQQEVVQEINRFRSLQHATGVPDDYTPEYIQRWAEATNSGATPETFAKRQIIAAKNKHYLFFNGNYREVHRDSLFVACREYSVPAFGHLGMQIRKTIDSTGKQVPKNHQELVDEYGTAALESEIHLGISQSFFDEKQQKFVQARCVPQSLDPEYSEAVDEWMRETTQSEKNFEEFRDWMAMVSNLSRPLAMLVLVGKTGLGKTSFAEGVAQLWASASVNMNVLFEPFQEAVLDCPMLFADEEFPKDHRGHVPSAKIRAALTSREHRINQKNQPRVKTVGFFRLMAGLQSLDKLNELSFRNRKADVEAIQQRVLVVHMREEARALFHYLRFVREQEIAKHALWLREERAQAIIDAKARFGIREPEQNAGATVYLVDRQAHILIEWCCRFLENRFGEESNEAPAFVARGKLFVHPRSVHDTWERLFELKDRYKPDLLSLQEAIKTISEEQWTQVRLPNGNRQMYAPVETETLRAFAQSHHQDMDLAWQLRIYSEAVFQDRSKYEFPPELYPTLADKRDMERAKEEHALSFKIAAD